MDGQSTQTQSMGDLAARDGEDRKMLRKALPRLRAAEGYIPDSSGFDKEHGALSLLVRQIGRHLGG